MIFSVALDRCEGHHYNFLFYIGFSVGCVGNLYCEQPLEYLYQDAVQNYYERKKSAARPCGIGCASSRFQGRSSRNTPLQQCDSNGRSRLGRGALRDDPKNGCEGDNILTVAFFNIEDITWSHGDTNFVQRVFKNIPRVSASNQ